MGLKSKKLVASFIDSMRYHAPTRLHRHHARAGARTMAARGPICQAQSSSASDHNSSDASPVSAFPSGHQLLSRAGVFSSLVILPASLNSALQLFSNGGSGGSGGSSGGGDGDGGGNGGPNGDHQPLFEVAADEKKAEEEEKEEEEEEQDEEEVVVVKDTTKDKGEEAWRELVTPDDEALDLPPGQRAGTNRCVEIVIEGWPQAGALPNLSDLRDLLNVQEGYIFDYQDIVDDRRKLSTQYDDYIATVDIKTEFVDSKTNHQRVIYKFTPYVYAGLDTIQIKGATLMPQSAIEGIVKACLPAEPYRVDIGVMDKVRAKIEKWCVNPPLVWMRLTKADEISIAPHRYQDRGLPFCYVGYFDGMEEGMLRANVIEAKINDVAVKYEKAERGVDDTEYDYYSEGRIVPADRIIEASGFKRGEHYHIDDGYDAMNNIYACGLLEDINIEPEQDMTDPSKINIRIKVDEIEPKSMQMDLDWTFQMKGGLPSINRQSLIPGGSVEISHENLFGDSQSLTVSLSSSDWRNPAQDLGFQFSYTEPFYAPNTTRNLQLFNTRKMSPIFTSPTEGEVPPVFVDRLGLKGWTSHCGGNDNKVEHSIMLQRINTSDENGEWTFYFPHVYNLITSPALHLSLSFLSGQTVTKGTKVARGYYSDNGPPTTISSSGTDLSLSYQHFSALDDVQFVNGNQLGRRLLCQVDQGLNVNLPLPNGSSFGLSGGLYNRLMVTFTKFMQLPGLPKLTVDKVWVDRMAPNTLVLHARGGNCLGDMGSYDYFSLGGPYSVRGYSYGELGACRRFLETAAEVRFPLKNHGLPGTAYAFVEYGTDLGSSKALEGNPTEYYRKAGSGMSLGAGVKLLGCCRFECARDMNAGKNSLLVNWGERF